MLLSAGGHSLGLPFFFAPHLRFVLFARASCTKLLSFLARGLNAADIFHFNLAQNSELARRDGDMVLSFAIESRLGDIS